MKALIVEDKAYIRKGLINLLETFETNVEIIWECASVKEAVVVAEACKPQLVFLDINLTDGTGFDFLHQVDYLAFKVIFITAYEEYALQALKIGAVDYLLKPVDVDDLKEALKKVANTPINVQKQRINTAKKVYLAEGETLILSLQDSYQVIDLKELVFCESDKGYTTFYLENGKKYIASKTLKEYEASLIKLGFVRPHQSYLVNIGYIEKYDKSGLIHLKNGATVPVSSRRKDHFVSVLLNKNHP